jgi:hypothetical protein
VTSDAPGGMVGRSAVYMSIRQLSTMLRPSVFASPGPWPSNAPMFPVAIGLRSMYAPCPTSVVHVVSTSWQQTRRRRFPATRHAPCEHAQKFPSSTPGSHDRPSAVMQMHVWRNLDILAPAPSGLLASGLRRSCMRRHQFCVSERPSARSNRGCIFLRIGHSLRHQTEAGVRRDITVGRAAAVATPYLPAGKLN